MVYIFWKMFYFHVHKFGMVPQDIRGQKAGSGEIYFPVL